MELLDVSGLCPSALYYLLDYHCCSLDDQLVLMDMYPLLQFFQLFSLPLDLLNQNRGTPVHLVNYVVGHNPRPCQSPSLELVVSSLNRHSPVKLPCTHCKQLSLSVIFQELTWERRVEVDYSNSCPINGV